MFRNVLQNKINWYFDTFRNFKTERGTIVIDFIPYKSNETLVHKYYQIPQELFDDLLIQQFRKYKYKQVIVLYNNLQDIFEKEIYFKGSMDSYYYFKRIGVIY